MIFPSLGVRPLLNLPKALDDIILTVGDEELVSESLEEIVESQRRVDIRIVVAIPSFRVFVKENGSDTGLLFGGDLSKIDVFLHTVGPVGDIAE